MSEISGKKSVVAVVPCDTYDEEKVYGALRKGVELLGGIGAFVKPEERILVKPNFLLAADADKAATTARGRRKSWGLRRRTATVRRWRICPTRC
mgnify:CR=1 FL=1